MRIESLSAITLFTRNMARAVEFYNALGFELLYGGSKAGFTSYSVGNSYLNLCVDSQQSSGGWGRIIFHVSDVDVMHSRVLNLGLQPEFAPQDASWGERYFHVLDPDGNEISFVKLIVQ